MGEAELYCWVLTKLANFIVENATLFSTAMIQVLSSCNKLFNIWLISSYNSKRVVLLHGNAFYSHTGVQGCAWVLNESRKYICVTSVEKEASFSINIGWHLAARKKSIRIMYPLLCLLSFMVLRCCYKAINQTPKKEYLTKNAMIVEAFVSMQEFLITK